MTLREWLFGDDGDDDEASVPVPPLYEQGLTPSEVSVHVNDGALRASVGAEDWFGDDQPAVGVDSSPNDSVKLSIRAWMDGSGNGSAFAHLDPETARDLAADLEDAADEVDDGGDGLSHEEYTPPSSVTSPSDDGGDAA